MAVYIDKLNGYDLKDLKLSIEKGLQSLRLDLTDKHSAVLKPNISLPAKPNSAIITHPKVVEATITVLREQGIKKITIAESPGGEIDAKRTFWVSGYSQLAKRLNVQLVNLNETERVSIKWSYGIIDIPKMIIETDLYINLPKIKTHGQTTVTLSLKNQKGLLSINTKKKFHYLWGLHKPLIELAKVISPDLVIVDGIEAMEGKGPSQGKKKKANVLIMGHNMLETDIVCCKVMDVNPHVVKHIRYGIEEGLGRDDPQTVGEDLEKVKTKFRPANEVYGRSLNIFLWRNPYACSLCFDSFSDAIKGAIKSPRHWFTFVPKFAYLSLFNRIDLLMGTHAQIPNEHGRIVCFGNCTKDIANENGFVFIKGCPPERKNIIKGLKAL